MRPLPWFAALALSFALLHAGCPSGSGGAGDAGTFDLDGTWRDPEGSIVTIDGSSGRLIAFPLGPVLGRDVFDVGDEYFRSIESTAHNRFEAELVQLETDPALFEGLAIESVSYAPCTIELVSEDSFKVTRADGSMTFFSREEHAIAERRGGACEGGFLGIPGAPDHYLCSDAYTEHECSYEALGKSHILSVSGSFEFWEGKTCPELGYAHRFDEPALYQHAEGDNATPGPNGRWGGLSPMDAGTHDAGAEDSGVIEPVTDGAVDSVQYLIFGTVWDHATADCPEGSATFDDWRSYYWEIVEGEWSDTYSEASEALEAKMMSEVPGARVYDVESSWFEYGREASHAVIIEYTQTLLAWDCRPQLITIGYGQTYEEALAQALETKANNDSESAPHAELEHITW